VDEVVCDFVPLMRNGNWVEVAVDGADVIDGTRYPVKSVEGKRVAVDGARVLLLFVLLLSEALQDGC